MKVLKVKCPTCKKETIYSEDNPYRPFCSAHCRTIDLGAWASNEYAIEALPEDEQELEMLTTAIINKYHINNDS